MRQSRNQRFGTGTGNSIQRTTREQRILATMGISCEVDVQRMVKRETNAGVDSFQPSRSKASLAVFPPELIRPMVPAGRLIGGTILDPFGGSGTTARRKYKENRMRFLLNSIASMSLWFPSVLRKFTTNLRKENYDHKRGLWRMVFMKSYSRNWRKRKHQPPSDWGQCRECGIVISKSNTKGHQRSTMTVLCYLQVKANERKRLGRRWIHW